MNIAQELTNRGVAFEIDRTGNLLRIVDAEQNLGMVLTFSRFELTYHFWDANGCSVSPVRPLVTLDEALAEFDRLIFIYYGDNCLALDACFKDWQPIEI